MDFVASAVMQKNVKTVPPSMTLAELETHFVQHQVSGFPVVEQGKLVGIASRGDLLRALSADGDWATGADEEEREARQEQQRLSAEQTDLASTLYVRDIMTTDVVTVGPNDYLHDVADLMYDKRLHRIVVVEETEVSGIITPFDFVRLYSHDRIGADSRPTRTKDF